jgi:predicted RNase H-like nuclease
MTMTARDIPVGFCRFDDAVGRVRRAVRRVLGEFASSITIADRGAALARFFEDARK